VWNPKKEESPFWVCDTEAKNGVAACLSVHLGRLRMFRGAVLLVNDEGSQFHEMGEVPLPCDHSQVQIVFPLVTLLYATFNIPVPPRPPKMGVNLWSLLMFPTESIYHVFPKAKPLQRVTRFECLDLENDAQWCPSKNKDTHGLKQNLRNNIFYRRPGSSDKSTMPCTYDTTEQTVLTEIVGYTKYIQSVHAKAGSFDPLVTVGEHCASCILSLEEEEDINFGKQQDLMLHGGTPIGFPDQQLLKMSECLGRV
jgi:hypothetical protein